MLSLCLASSALRSVVLSVEEMEDLQIDRVYDCVMVEGVFKDYVELCVEVKD